MSTVTVDGKKYETDLAKTKHTLIRLLRMVRPWWGELTLTSLAAMLNSASTIALAAVGALIVGLAAEGTSVLELRPYLIALAVLTVFKGILAWAESYISHRIAYAILAMMRSRVFDAIEPAAPAYILKRRSGDIISTVMADVETVELYFAHTLMPTLVALVMPLTALIILGSLNWMLPLVLLPFLFLVIGTPIKMHHIGDAIANRLRIELGETNAHMVDSIQGLREIVVFGRGKSRLSEVEANSRALVATQKRNSRYLGSLGGLTEGCSMLGSLTVLVVGVLMVGKGMLPSHQLPLMLLMASAAFGPVMNIAKVAKQVAMIMASAERVFTVLDEPPVVRETPDAAPVGAVKPTLTFEDVTFRYQPDEPPVLRNISFECSTGENVAVVGPSGSGKTTLVNLLLRFWDPQHGKIMIGGRDIRTLSFADLRNLVSVVQQDAYLFNTSIRDNITIGKPDATNAEIEDAARKAYIHDFIASLPDGYDTMLGERGAKLSGGERQRISIARALLKNAPILILDEATSNLDSENEQAIRDGIDNLMEGRTTLVIAHRLSTIATADKVVVLDHGRVVEAGTHDDLMGGEGMYARIIRVQRDVIA
ncbi:MAG: thiol reductant ABC exporter subunit CydC [Euryarchaeota archaeon]|nr:thiol reductant ABC exporter subunit CydC [Euryarchaeota archaeon]